MIGLLTMHHSYNYGAALQAFALCETIVEMGHEVEIIDLRATYNKMYEDEATQYIIKRRPPGIVNLHRSEYQQKAELFTSFFDTYMSRTERADAPGDIDALLFPIQHGMLYFVGFDLLPPFVAWSAASVSQEQREGYLNDYAARLQVWTTAETIPFPSLDDYDQTLQRKA